MAILTMDQQTKETTGTNRGMIWTRDTPVPIEDEDESEVDHEDFMRGIIAKFGPRCFVCNLEGHFKSDCHTYGMLWQISSIQGMRKLYRV